MAVFDRWASFGRRQRLAQARPPKKWKRHDATQVKTFSPSSRETRQSNFRRNEAKKPVGGRMLRLGIKFPDVLCAPLRLCDLCVKTLHERRRNFFNAKAQRSQR